MNNPGEDLDQKEKYQQKLDDILSTGLTAENINTYSDDALNGLIGLIDEIKNDPAYKWDFSLNTSTREQEDEMFRQILGINVSNALEGIIGIGDDIRHLGDIIEKHRQNTEQMTYVPADKLGFTAIVANGGDFSKSPVVPKTKATLLLLEKDYGVNLNNEEEFQMFTGVNSKNMMRRISYDMINLPLLNRAIVSCDEIGNRTFVFDTNMLEEKGISLNDIKNMTKQEIQDLLANNSELGTSLTYSKNYLANLAELIKTPTKEFGKRIEDNPDQFSQKKQYLKEVAKAPDGWVTASGFIRSHRGIDYGTLKKLIETNTTLESKEFRAETGHIRTHYREKDLEDLAGPLIGMERVPDGWVTASGFIRSHRGIDYGTLKKLIETNTTLESKEFRAETGHIRTHYREKDLEDLAGPSVNAEKAPDGWVTVADFIMSHEGISKTAINYFINNNLESREFRAGNGHMCSYYKEKDLETLADPLVNTGEAPDGWVTIKGFVKKYGGVANTTLRNLVKAANLEPKNFRIEGGQRHLHYREEDLKRIIFENEKKKTSKHSGE